MNRLSSLSIIILSTSLAVSTGKHYSHHWHCQQTVWFQSNIPDCYKYPGIYFLIASGYSLWKLGFTTVTNFTVHCAKVISLQKQCYKMAKFWNFTNLWAYLSKVMWEFVLIFNDMGKPSLEAKIHREVR